MANYYYKWWLAIDWYIKWWLKRAQTTNKLKEGNPGKKIYSTGFGKWCCHCNNWTTQDRNKKLDFNYNINVYSEKSWSVSWIWVNRSYSPPFMLCWLECNLELNWELPKITVCATAQMCCNLFNAKKETSWRNWIWSNLLSIWIYVEFSVHMEHSL